MIFPESLAAPPRSGGRPERAPRWLLEREDQLAVVARSLEAARQGRGGALVVVGDAGTGKSALLEVAAAQAAATNMGVARAKGADRESDLSFSYVEQLTGPLASHRGLPSDPGAMLDRRVQVHQVARQQLRSWGQGGPIAVLLDDLHWSDPDSLGALAFVLRRLSFLPVLVVAAFRAWPEDAARLATGLVHDGVAEALATPPLSKQASTTLLRNLLGGQPDPTTIERAWAFSRGNPFLLEASVRALVDNGSLSIGAPGGPGDLGDALVLSRLGGLSPPALACAQAASVLGSRLRLGDVHTLVEMTDVCFAEAMDALAGAGVVVEATAGWVAFSHDMLAEAIYRDLAPARRRLYHERAFRLYAGQGDLETAASHALAAGLERDEQAVGIVAAAGRRALASGAIGAGLRHLRDALGMAGPEPPLDLLREYADALFAAGRSVAALDAYRQLLTREAGPERQHVLAKLARAQAFCGQLDESIHLYDDLLSQSVVPSERLGLLLERSHVVWERGGPAEAVGALREAVNAFEPGSEGLERVAPVETFFRVIAGDRSGLEPLEQAASSLLQRLATGTADPADIELTMGSLPMLASICAVLERWDEADALIDEGSRWLRAAGSLRACVPLLITRIGMRLNQDALVECLAVAEDLQEEVELDALQSPYVALYQAHALLRLGRVEEASALMAAVEATGRWPWLVGVYLEAGKGEQLLMQGRPADAVAQYRKAQALVERLGLGDPCLPQWCAGALEAAFAAGATDDAEQIQSWLDAHRRSAPSAWATMVAHGGVAGCAARRGRTEEAERHYRQALAVTVLSPFDRGRIALRFGRWLRLRRRPLEARPVLADALRAGEETGAVLLATEAAAELAAAGGRRRRAPGAELTPQETRVVELARRGATTREMASALHLSPRTVETHLSHAYRKLQVSSKTELRQATWG